MTTDDLRALDGASLRALEADVTIGHEKWQQVVGELARRALSPEYTPMASAPPELAPPSMPMNYNPGVVIKDINMSFDRLVVFMIKASLAAIPAGIIVGLIVLLFSGVFAGLISGVSRH